MAKSEPVTHYDYVDIDNVHEALNYSISRLPMVDPVQLPCKHEFFRDWITASLRHKAECPVCRKRFSERAIKAVTSRTVHAMLGALKVRCTEGRKMFVQRPVIAGCSWIGPRDQLATHLESCPYFKETSPYVRGAAKVAPGTHMQECSYKIIALVVRAMQADSSRQAEQLADAHQQITEIQKSSHDFFEQSFTGFVENGLEGEDLVKEKAKFLVTSCATAVEKKKLDDKNSREDERRIKVERAEMRKRKREERNKAAAAKAAAADRVQESVAPPPAKKRCIYARIPSQLRAKSALTAPVVQLAQEPSAQTLPTVQHGHTRAQAGLPDFMKMFGSVVQTAAHFLQKLKNEPVD
ncbi:hypothetical protein HK097_000589 [Rhizophlyctis rosea]|uniref:RING-type domain-containing protein n=1 Tax=Rhizophlyctis rosea TaxID=64517 RepID=A0AAD5SDI5_9FUNG|nr:hypothetical protein HK097_000589 [Rhizophlyctis rosea]